VSRVVLITGATGTIGARLAKRLVDRGFAVRALILPGDPLAQRLDGLSCERIEGDITRAATLVAALAGVHTVYHLAAIILSEDAAVLERVNVSGTSAMIDGAAVAGVRHFIHVSSASVGYSETTPYSRSKQACEARVRRSAVPHTIVRPTLVYDRGGGEEWMRYWNQLKRWRRFPFVPIVGDGAARKSPVHVDDLIEGLVALAGNEAAHGKTYDLGGGEVLSMRELTELMLRFDGVDPTIVPIPVPVCRLVAKIMGRVMAEPPITLSAIAGVIQDAAPDLRAEAAELGYRPKGVREGFALCYPEPRAPSRSS
jgi:nucleoside-diphosphate-sugar epimerase